MIKGKLKNKSILYITHSYNNFIKSQIEEISKDFKKVYVLVRHKPVTFLASFKFLSFLPYFQELNYHSKKYKFDLSNLPKNVKVYPTPIWYVPFLDWFYRNLGKWHYKSVKKVISKYNLKFELVHSHMLWSAGYVGKEIAKEHDVPFVVTGHGTDVYKLPFKSKFWRQHIKDVLNSANEIITVSQNNLRKLYELGIKKKIHVIPNGFDEKLFISVDKNKLRKKLGLPLKSKIFLTVANMEPVKGHSLLIDAIKAMDNINDLYFVFIGGGSLYTKMKRYVKEAGLNKNILLTNFMKHDEVINYELASDYFILPSYNEGVPTVMFEAFAAGLPFISTNVGGIPEVARDFNSILCRPGDVQELKDAIEKAKNIKWDRKKIFRYSKSYTWKNIGDKIVKIYEELL